MPPRTRFVLAVVASFVLTLGGGGALGLYMLLAPLVGLAVERHVQVVRLHGQLQLVGFVTLLVAAVGLELIPRSRGARPIVGALPRVVIGAIVAGTLARVLGLTTVGAGLVAAGCLTYAYLALRAIATGENAPRPDDAPLAGAVIWLAVGTGLELAAALDPMTAGTTHTAALTAILFGAIGGHILAFATRLGPAFAGLTVPGGRSVIAAGALWNVAVLLATAGYPLGWLAGGAAWLVLANAMDGGARRPILSEAPLHAVVARWAFRAVFAWAIASCVIAVLGSETLARHAFAFGVVLSALFGVGARLLPGLAGGRPASPRIVAGALALVSFAAALRVLAELEALPYLVAAAVSGVAAYTAIAAFALAVIVGMRQGRAAPPAGASLAPRRALR